MTDRIAQTTTVHLVEFGMSMSDCSRRLGIVLSIFAGAIAVFGLMLVPAGAQPDPAQATTASGDSDGAGDLAVRIPAPPDCLAKVGNWAEPEKWAWQQICAREAIDFDERYKKNGKKPEIELLEIRSKPPPWSKLRSGNIRESRPIEHCAERFHPDCRRIHTCHSTHRHDDRITRPCRQSGWRYFGRRRNNPAKLSSCRLPRRRHQLVADQGRRYQHFQFALRPV